MSGLFTMLGQAAHAMDAQRYGLDVTGQNIANVNTPGYSRRKALLVEDPPPDAYNSGGGVRVEGVAADRNRLLERRLQNETPAQHKYSALAQALSEVEAAVDEDTNSLSQRLTEFFDSFSRLADTPTSATARQEVIIQGQELSRAFNDLSNRFEAAQANSDEQVRDTVDRINTLAEKIRGFNHTLSGVDQSSPEALHLQDQARLAVEELTKLANVEVIERSDGGYDVGIGGGRPLVVGSEGFPLTTANRAVTGFADVKAADGTVITGAITGGQLAGYIDARDNVVPGYQDSLDELAYSVVSEVNALHTTGFDASGTAGQVFFQALGSSADAAELMAMNANLTATGGEALVAASGVATAVGNNDTARALASLRDQRVLAGNTASFSDYWSRIVFRVGRDSQTARQEDGNRNELLRQLQSLRDGISGVSMDEEAANLMRFQRAYEANARYFQTVDATLSTLMNLVQG